MHIHVQLTYIICSILYETTKAWVLSMWYLTSTDYIYMTFLHALYFLYQYHIKSGGINFPSNHCETRLQ